jgi:hypothetical protein
MIGSSLVFVAVRVHAEAAGAMLADVGIVSVNGEVGNGGFAKDFIHFALIPKG